MTTLAAVLAECRHDYLMTGTRDARNTLAGSHNNSTDTFTVNYPLGTIAKGTRLSVDLEDVYVYALPTSTTVTVGRGDFGTTAVTHADKASVLVNPRFSDAQLLRAVNRELDGLSSPDLGLFQMKSVDVTFNAAVDGYDLTSVTNVTSIYKVAYKDTGSAREWPVIDPSGWQYIRDLSTAEFASGKAIFIRKGGWPGNAIRVWYKAPYTALATVTDDVAAVSGLHSQAHDILALGAAIRLTAGREIHRNFDETQGNTRRATEVPPGANLGANRGLQQLYMKRVREEATRLNVMYPQAIR